jgi:N-methylhydantoinase A/oxoprolinase/acetone carboxylase beta subunit
MLLLGVDVGGTFTDAVLVAAGTIHTAKAPTTPEDQSLGVLDAVAAVLETAGARADEVDVFAHGMTVATNALLEGDHARTAFVATDGFTDVVELGRQARADLYRLCRTRPAPLTPAERRFPAPERVTPAGVLRELTEDDAGTLAEAVAAQAPEAVAVCLLHSYAEPAHEQRIGDALRAALPGVHVSLSHEVVGTFREYERAATTEVDAALSPLLAAYLDRLADGADRAGLPEPAIMQSSGGLTDLRTAAAHAALTVLSGPAGGAAAAALLAERCAEPDLLCFDMGGTSCDVCVVEGGVVRETAAREVAGRPLSLPMVDIHTVGAGGGSIAWRDAGGALRVGPRSAGARPGPACYGRGGTEPTVTDANLVLGRLDPAAGLAGGVRLDVAAAEAAVGTLARALDLDVRACAEGIVRVADAEMVQALRVMTVERGVDPRGFALLAFGGAGPLHACAVAHELGMDRVLVPRTSGVLSALGLAAAERRRDRARTVLLRGPEITAAALRPLPHEADAAATTVSAAYDVRYRGQSHELTVRDVPPDPQAVRAAFVALHEERYGYAEPDGEIEVVTIRERRATAGPDVRLDAGDDLPADVAGPAVLSLPETTVWVADGWCGHTDATGTLVLERTP